MLHLAVEGGVALVAVAEAALAREERQDVSGRGRVGREPAAVRPDLVAPALGDRHLVGRSEVDPDAVTERAEDPGDVGRFLLRDCRLVGYPPDVDPFSPRAGGSDEPAGTREVGAVVGAVRGRASGVRAVTAVTHEPGEEGLARRNGDERASVHAGDLP